MKVAAVVVTYNRKILLQECIDAILNQSLKVDLLIVVDNASTDGTDLLFERGSKYCLPCIDYHRMKENTGGAGGFYEGVKYAYSLGMEWIWIMDDDTIPTENALKAFYDSLNILEEEPSFLASSVYGMHGEAMNVPLIDNRESKTGYPDWYNYLADGLLKVESATFVSIIINRNAIQKVGFPYKDLFIWGDDREYTLRLSRYFGKAYMCGKSKVIHKRIIAKKISIENEEDPKRIAQYFYNYRNILINAKEYRNGTRTVIKQILSFSELAFKILLDKRQHHRWRKVLAIYKGIWGYLVGSYDKKKFKNRFRVEENL